MGAAGNSNARSSVGGGVGYKGMRVMGKVDRMEDGRRRRQRSGSDRKQPFIGPVKVPFRVERRQFVPLVDFLAERARKTSGFGVDFVMPMGIHGIGTSPSASGDLRDLAQKYKVHVAPGSAKVTDGGPFSSGSPFEHLDHGKGKKKTKKRRKR
jgi:hypothetical protein